MKIDGAYIRHIDELSDKKLFIEAIFRATNSIDLPLIAEMVETKGELEVIRELGLFGVMGRLIGPPEPMCGGRPFVWKSRLPVRYDSSQSSRPGV